jgi:hypothetical protein
VTDLVEIARKLTKAQRECVSGGNGESSAWFELIEIGVADWETNFDDDLFFWLTPIGLAVRAELEKM